MSETVTLFAPDGMAMADCWVGGHKMTEDGVTIPVGAAVGYLVSGWKFSPDDQKKVEAFKAKIEGKVVKNMLSPSAKVETEMKSLGLKDEE